jgi:uroporphyrinogen-III synthase
MVGLRVAVTAGRRGAEAVEAFTRLGASVLWAPTVEVRPASTRAVGEETLAALAARPAWVVVSTAEGLTRWVEGAGRERAAVLELLGRARVVARGAKAASACRAHGIGTVLTPSAERGVDVARLVIDRAGAGAVVAALVGGNGSPGLVSELRAAGLAVHPVAPYRWGVPVVPPAATDQRVSADELVRGLCAGALDAVAFTSPPAVDGLFAAASALGLETTMREALSGSAANRVLVAAIGPATAEALEQRGVGVAVCPLQPRVAALASALAAAPIGFRSFGGHEPLLLDPGARSVTGPGGGVELSDLQFALLSSLARRPGMTCPTGVLLREVWGESRATAAARRRLEVLASRLRARLVPIEVNLVPVPKRGYRLELREGAPALLRLPTGLPE